ncbi:TetR/AcrR family transcriptional regulator [Mycolicibacterium wolinskyi]|uniref:TetR/AcrR family transcriptional regulator n=1 Tax=Mycolicibacterium wolinskyi TaxID=59750 RepID=UPI000831B2D6|nr:TetR/AcrR family transcriptional regulator [Mycolicibacterium wolinskyi]
MASRALQRTRTHVLDSARDFVEQHGVEQLSMRRLADEAGVSVRTLYNHFGDKEGLLTALVQRSLDSMDVAVHQLSSTDPIERIWESITLSIDKVVADIPKAVVRAVLMDDRLLDQVNLRWSGWELILTEIKAATRRGALRDDIDPDVLADHAAMVLFHLQRRWTAGEITADELRASALHAFDICLLAIARPRARSRILTHARSMLTANQAAAEA